MGISDKAGGEEINGQARWHRYWKTGVDTAVEDMQDGNRRDVGRRRWRNMLEGQKRTGQILTGNYYQPKGVLLL